MYEILKFVVYNILIISFFIFISFKFHNYTLNKNKKTKKTFLQFINNGKLPSSKNILIGLLFGIVFGFLDNFGLWIGINKLEKYLPGGLLTKAALGNTYSDFLGATIGTSISIIAKDSVNYDNDDEPIWINSIGIFIGCILGLFLGRLITNKN